MWNNKLATEEASQLLCYGTVCMNGYKAFQVLK